MANGDTVVAQSTPYGYGGIGVVRVTGPSAVKILGRLSGMSKNKLRTIKPRKVYKRSILDENNNNNFNKYYINRVKRIKMVNQRSKLNYFIFHLSNPILVLIRNIILKMIVNNKKFLNKYLGQIYNYK